MYPHIRLAGTHFERGLTYGRQAKDRIHRSLQNYKETYLAYAGLTWPEACKAATRYEAPIRELDPNLMDEICGISVGADLEISDVLSMNCRTEIMFEGLARLQVAGQSIPSCPPAECTTFAAMPHRTAAGNTLLGQNWDWMDFAKDTLVVLEVEQADLPNFITVVEAGLLAKFGMNSSGIGLVTNALVSEGDLGGAGLPYHVLLRKIFDCRNIEEATQIISRPRASSANYMMASADGSVINLECEPGGMGGVSFTTPKNGYLAHTNHFISPSFCKRDVMLQTHPDSLSRLQSVESDLNLEPDLSIASIQGALRSHTDYPTSVCTHHPENPNILEDAVTVASVIMDLSNRRMWLADGQPCANPFRELDLDFLYTRRNCLPL